VRKYGFDLFNWKLILGLNNSFKLNLMNFFSKLLDRAYLKLFKYTVVYSMLHIFL
jgi:hypothetical protein